MKVPIINLPRFCNIDPTCGTVLSLAMKTSALDANIAIGAHRHGTPLWQPRFLHLVSQSEIADLRQALLRGAIPLDFEDKLNRLAKGDLIQQYVAKHCVDFIGL